MLEIDGYMNYGKVELHDIFMVLHELCIVFVL